MKTFGDIVRKDKPFDKAQGKQINTDKQADTHRSEEKRSFFGKLKKVMNREMGGGGKSEVRSMNDEVGRTKEEVRSPKEEGGIMSNVKCQLSNVRHYLLAALIFLLPLWFLPWGADKLGLAKQLLMTVFVGVGFLLWIYKSITSGKIVYKKSAINTGILVLLLAFLLSTIFSLHPATSIYESSANFGNLWNFCLLALFYFLVVNDKREIREKETVNRESLIVNRYSIKLLDVFLISTGLVIFYALLKILGINILGGFTKSIGFNTLGTMNSVAIIAGLAVVMCIGDKGDKRDKGDMGEKGRESFQPKAGRPRDEIVNRESKKGLFIAIGILSFVFIVLTNFAPVWYGLILTMIMMIVSQARKGGQIQMKTFFLPIAILAISLVFVLWGFFGARIGFEQPKVNLKNLPTEVYVSHKTSLAIANKTLNQSQNLEQSFFGVGLGNFNKSWLLHKPVDLSQTDFWQTNFIQGFSSFTTLITEAGYFGILAIIFFLVLVFKEIFSYLKGPKEQEMIYDLRFTIYVLVFLIAIWFFYSYNLTLYFCLFLVLGLIVRSVSLKGDLSLNDADINAEQTPSVNQRSNQRNIRVLSFAQPIKKALTFSLSLVFLAITIVFAMYFEIRHYISFAHTATATKQEAINIDGLSQEDAIKKVENELDKKINLLVNAYNLDKNNDVALRNISQYYINKINLTIQENKNLDISSFVQSAILAAKKATEINSAEYLNYLNLAQVYESFIALSGDAYGFAFDAYDKAAKLNPNDPSILFGIARSQFSEAIKTTNSINAAQDVEQKDELVKKQDQLLSDAIQNLNKAITLKANYTSAHQLLAQIYDAQGKIDEAIISATNLVILNQQDAGLWFQLGLLYYKKSDIDKAETAFAQSVALKDDYSNARYFLGLVYSEKNEKTKAIEQFEKVAELNPDNQEVKTILENLRVGNDALAGIVPPNIAPEERTEAPIK